MAIAGKVAPTFKGDYDATVTYQFYDVVRHNNSLWMSKKSNTLGIEPAKENAEYWFLAIDGSFTDASTLGGQLPEYYATAQSVTDIENGTTAVGNALKLNGLTAEEFLKSTVQITEDTDFNEMRTEGRFYFSSSVTLTNAPEGAKSGWLDVIHLDGANGVVHRWTENAVSSFSAERIRYGSSWKAWKKTNDGGNADTVDNLHASDFQNKNDRREITSLIDSVTTQTDIRALMRQFPSGHYTWASSYNRNVIMPFVNDTGMHINWERKQQDDNNMYYGILTITSMIDNSQWATCSVFNNTSYTEWKSFLPTDGSVPLSGGALGVNGGLGLFSADGNHASVLSKNGVSDDNNSRALMLFNTQYMPYDETCLQIWKRTDGAITVETVLHTGNSQKVATSASAPSDTSALWYDTTNKILKRYVDGAWQA